MFEGDCLSRKVRIWSLLWLLPLYWLQIGSKLLLIAEAADRNWLVTIMCKVREIMLLFSIFVVANGKCECDNTF